MMRPKQIEHGCYVNVRDTASFGFGVGGYVVGDEHSDGAYSVMVTAVADLIASDLPSKPTAPPPRTPPYTIVAQPHALLVARSRLEVCSCMGTHVMFAGWCAHIS